MIFRILPFLLIAGIAVGCGETSGDGGGSGEVTIETFNLALAGAFVPNEEARRQQLPAAIAAAEADILCLQEVWTQADKVTIRDAAATNFPHSVIFEDTLDTPLDDDTDQNGEVPPTPPTVPCPDDVEVDGVSIADQMTEAVNCVRDGMDAEGNACSTIPGSDDGQTTSTECAADACLSEVSGLLFGNEQQNRCYSCVATQLPTSTFGEIKSSCPTVPNQEIAFNGQNGVMILSRYPLKDEVNWVIPGTWNRRVIMSATAELPNGSELDVYCNHLSPIFDDITLPYFGQYGDGMTGAAGWEAEVFLQAEKLIAHVEATSEDTPAIVLGDLNVGRGDEGLMAEGEPVLDLLEEAFPPAYVADYTPACTFCVDNPNVGLDSNNGWIDHILMYNLTADAVTATKRTFDEDVVDIGGGVMVPLSDHYGMQSVIQVP